jgi:hypothetical protein
MGKLTIDEMVAILEDLAVNGGDSAKVQAIKMLLEIHRAEPPVNQTAFDDLDTALKDSEWRKRHGRDS